VKPVVALDLSCLEARVETGVERYARRLAEHLPEVAPDLSFRVIVRPNRPAPSVSGGARIVSVPSPLPRAAWRETAMPLALRRLGVSLLHAPVAAVPIMAPVPRVATIHDVASREKGARLGRDRLRLLHATRAASVLIVPSFATRDALAGLEPGARDRIAVIPHGVDPDFRPHGTALNRKQYGIPEGRFVLWVGTVRPRKDPLVLVEAFARLIEEPTSKDLHLVMVGDLRMDPAVLRRPLEATGLGERLILAGYLPRQDLPDLYRAASVVALPSRLEGFGLPALEAMACGRPLVVSGDSALRELTGEAALSFPTGDAGALTAVLARLLGDEGLRRRVAAAALERAQLYSWEGTARAHAEIYRLVLEASGVL
jgi:glycosyltransferase involved in cell wall biosynthesis